MTPLPQFSSEYHGVTDAEDDARLEYVLSKLAEKALKNTMITPSEPAVKAIARARSMIGKGIRYKLGAGGRNPNNATPETFRDGVLGSDCAGFVAWSWGFDRLQSPTLKGRPGQFNPTSKGSLSGYTLLDAIKPSEYNFFDYYGGWINTDSMLQDAFDNNADWFTHLPKPIPGAIIVYGSVGKGKDRRIGHEGLVVEAPIIWDPKDVECWKKVKVVDCRSASPAILERDAMAWFGNDRKKRPKQSQFVWPNFVAGEPVL